MGDLQYKANANHLALRLCWLFASVVLTAWVVAEFRMKNWFDFGVIALLDAIMIYMLGRSYVVEWDEEVITLRKSWYGKTKRLVQIRWCDVKQIRYRMGTYGKGKIRYWFYFADKEGRPFTDLGLYTSDFWQVSKALHQMADHLGIPVIDEFEELDRS